MWGPGYEISFEFYLNSDGGTSDYQWLFGVVSDADNMGYGQPGIFYNSGNIPIWFRLHDHKYGYVSGTSYGTVGTTLDQWYYPYGGTVTVDIQKWHKLSVSSIKENGKVSKEASPKSNAAFEILVSLDLLPKFPVFWNFSRQLIFSTT